MKKVTKVVCRKDSNGHYAKVYVCDEKGNVESFRSSLDNSLYHLVCQTKPGHAVDYGLDSLGNIRCFANLTLGIAEACSLLELLLAAHY